MDETYEETLLGSGYIANWPGMHPHGARVIRSQLTGDVVEVLPPATEEALPPLASTPMAEEALSETIAHPESEVVQ